MGVFRHARVFVLASAVWCLTVANARAQTEGIIKGRVESAADRAVMPQVAVTLTAASSNEPVRTLTDAGGIFTFVNVRAGAYVVSAGASGFQRRDINVVLEPREVLSLTVSLELARVDVNVTVTADPMSALGTHSPSSTVLSAERIQSVAAFKRTNLPEAIVTAAPGMIRGHDDFVHIRGHEIALNPLIDGVSFWENTHSLFSSGISPDVIETANVMTGGFSAEYGNRFGGVIDIVSKSGRRMDHLGDVTVSAGDAGRRRVAGELGARRGSLGSYAFGTLFESDRFLSPPDRTAIHDSARGGNVFLSLDKDLESNGAFRATLLLDGTNLQVPKTPVDQELRPAANARQDARQQSAIVSWNRAGAATALSTSIYQRWSRVRLHPASGPLTAQAMLNRELLTFGGKLELTRVVGRHVLKAGVDAVRLRPEETLDYNYAGYRDLTHLLGLPHIHVVNQRIVFAGEESGGQVSVFVQDRLPLMERVTLDLGVRVDRYGLVTSATHASPRVNVAVRTAGQVIVHGSYNRFFVPPAIEGVLSSSAGLTTQIREIDAALPALEPTIEDQLETGASALIGPIQLGVTGYYRTTDNPVHTTVWPDSRIYSYASFDRARAYGLELKTEMPGLGRHGMTGYVNYALGRVYFYNPVTGGFITEAEHISDTNRFVAPMDQTHTLTAGTSWRHARTGFWTGATVEYGSGTPIGHGGSHEHAEGEADHDDAASADDAERVPEHFTANLSFGIDLWRDANRQARLGLRLDVENITNRAYVIARESAFSPAQYAIPRLISMTARVRF